MRSTFDGSSTASLKMGWKALPSLISARVDDAAGKRRIPFGEKTTSGLRYSRIICLRRRWKYCAAVVTLTRCMDGTKGLRASGSLVS